MPLFTSLVWLFFHLAVAYSFNFIVNYIGWTKNGEILTLYFMFMAVRNHDLMCKFSLAYKANPEMVKLILDTELHKEEPEIF